LGHDGLPVAELQSCARSRIRCGPVDDEVARDTAARKYTDLQVEASLQLSIYSYATSMNGLADQEDLRLRFDVLTKTKQPELHRYWTTRDRAANRRLFRLVAEVLRAIEAGVFHPNPGWACKDCPFRSRCWAWG
jgi:hypothetical protein